MAHNDGPIKFNGSLGNIRSYYDSGLKKTILTTKGGANKNLILNNPAFARTRDCINEFTACSIWASLLRRSFLDIDHLMYSRYYAEIVKLTKEIQVKDQESPYGFRSIEASKSAYMLREISFNRQHPFNGVIRDAYSIVLSPDKKTVNFTMNGFTPMSKLSWPTRFSAFRLYLAIAQVSDMVWNERDKRFNTIYSDLERLTQCTVTDWMGRNMEPVDIEMEVSFDEPALTQSGTTVVVALGIEMATDVSSGGAYIPPGNGTVGIVECFV